MDVVIILCLIAMAVLVAVIFSKFFLLNRSDRYDYLSNFKKGKFIMLLFIAIPLYYIGYAYGSSSNGVILDILASIKSSCETLVLKFDFSSPSSLMNTNELFRVAMYLCYILATINAILFAASLVGQRIINYIRKIRTTVFAKRVYVIVGYNEKNTLIIKSIDKKKHGVILLTDKADSVRKFAYVEKIAYSHLNPKDSLNKKLNRLFKNYNSRLVYIIINTEDDARNLIYVEEVAVIVDKYELYCHSIENKKGLACYVFGNPQNASTFLHFTEKTNGTIRYINKYLLISLDFIEKYPLTEFMGADEIDFKTATIKNDVNINVVMIGFGQTSQQLFLTSVANNQFATLIDGAYVEKPVNYYIYDKRDSRNDKKLNHNYYRFSNELDKDKKYLDLPNKPANEEFFVLDINDNQFYKSIRENLKPTGNGKSFNYIIISYGADMENIDFAEKIVAKLKEWNLFEKTKVFVKIRDSRLSKKVIHGTFEKESGFIIFGNEQDIIYNVEQIISEKQELMARDKHLSYSIKAGMSEEDEVIARNKALVSWLRQNQVQRESNIYACLSIRMKLHLLGYDYVPQDSSLPSANEKFLKVYQEGDPINYSATDPIIKGKKAINYTNDYVEGSIRQHFAILEHQRWNAYMITCGYVPSTIEQIEAGDSKNVELRRHGNITTFKGLIDYRKIVAKLRNCSEENTDVIRYDYEIMDDLVWILTNSGHKIVKRYRGDVNERKE